MRVFVSFITDWIKTVSKRSVVKWPHEWKQSATSPHVVSHSVSLVTNLSHVSLDLTKDTPNRIDQSSTILFGTLRIWFLCSGLLSTGSEVFHPLLRTLGHVSSNTCCKCESDPQLIWIRFTGIINSITKCYISPQPVQCSQSHNGWSLGHTLHWPTRSHLKSLAPRTEGCIQFWFKAALDGFLRGPEGLLRLWVVGIETIEMFL